MSSEQEWLGALIDIPEWRPPNKNTVVLAPHPDDETLGAGCLVARQVELGMDVTLVAATDGEAAYKGVAELAHIRREEQIRAATELGLHRLQIAHLGLPDGKLQQQVPELISKVARFVRPDTLLVAPWKYDPHPDHEACGQAAEELAKRSGAQLAAYFFWTWHRADPGDTAALPLRRFSAQQRHQEARERALICYGSQLSGTYGEPILPQLLLAPARRSFETFLVSDARS